MTSGSHPEEKAPQMADDPEDSIVLGDSEAPAVHGSAQDQRSSRALTNPIHENRACILPLYEWLSLGDGGIGAVETAMGIRSVSGQLFGELVLPLLEGQDTLGASAGIIHP